VKKIGPILVLLTAFAWTKDASSPSDYSINIHVSSSRATEPGVQRLDVVIDGKKYKLQAPANGLFSLGDYKAKLVRDEHKGADVVQVYELLLPGQKTRQFVVVGQTE
jgi:hypothetical protein